MSEREFEALIKAFPQGSRREIEILPSSFNLPSNTYILQDAKFIGIPKQVLIKAFLHARKDFMSKFKENEYLEPFMNDASRIMLLFDTEHLTAVNFRKRRIQYIIQETPNLIEKATHDEFVFLNSILTSPLHRQSKSPTLWFHRWWVIQQVVNFGSPFLSADEELDHVMISGERHAMNYYAWQYARRILSVDQLVNEQVILDLTTKVQSWCLAHPTDASGWAFLYFMLAKISSPSFRSTIIQQVIDFSVKTNWNKESLHQFLNQAEKLKS